MRGGAHRGGRRLGGEERSALLPPAPPPFSVRSLSALCPLSVRYWRQPRPHLLPPSFPPLIGAQCVIGWHICIPPALVSPPFPAPPFTFYPLVPPVSPCALCLRLAPYVPQNPLVRRPIILRIFIRAASLGCSRKLF